MKEGSTLPEHMRRMMRKLGAEFIRLVSARSAPVYEHQLHKNPTIRGSKFLLFVFNFAASFHLHAEHALQCVVPLIPYNNHPLPPPYKGGEPARRSPLRGGGRGWCRIAATRLERPPVPHRPACR